MPLAHGILGLLHYGSMSGYDLSKVFFSGARVREFDAARADSEEYRPGLEAESLFGDMAADFNRQYIRMCRAWAQDCLQRLPRDTTEAEKD